MVTPCVTTAQSRHPEAGTLHRAWWFSLAPQRKLRGQSSSPRVTLLELAMFPVSRKYERPAPLPRTPSLGFSLLPYTEGLGTPPHSCGGPRVRGAQPLRELQGPRKPASCGQVSLASSKAPEKLLDPRGTWLRTGLMSLTLGGSFPVGINNEIVLLFAGLAELVTVLPGASFHQSCQDLPNPRPFL